MRRADSGERKLAHRRASVTTVSADTATVRLLLRPTATTPDTSSKEKSNPKTRSPAVDSSASGAATRRGGPRNTSIAERPLSELQRATTGGRFTSAAADTARRAGPGSPGA